MAYFNPNLKIGLLQNLFMKNKIILIITIFGITSALNFLWIIAQEGIYSDEKGVTGGFFVNPDLMINYIILGITLSLSLIQVIALITKKNEALKK